MLFVKTLLVALTAPLAAALSVPEIADRELVERNSCTGPDGNWLTCPKTYVPPSGYA